MNASENTSERTEPRSAPSVRRIALCVPEIRGNEWEYVKQCLDTSWVSSVGAFVDRFEQSVADYVGSAHAVATTSGTAALHICLIVAGIEPDEEVVVPSITFIAPANAVRYVGAWPTFLDVDPEYWQLDPEKLADFFQKGCDWRDGKLINRVTRRRVRAILPVHILGHPCDMDAILELAQRYDLLVIEDATESLGATYRGRMTGTIGQFGCYSFNGNKLITTGGGGMIATSNADWAAEAKYLTNQAKDDPVEYIHERIGYNYRLTNLQAGVGVAQMEQLDRYVAAKRRIAARYEDALGGLPGVTTPQEASWASSTFWLYTVLIDEDVLGISSRGLLDRFEQQGIETRPLWQPMHLSPAHSGSFAFECDVAERLWRQGLSLPCSVGLNAEDQQRVIQQLQVRRS